MPLEGRGLGNSGGLGVLGVTSGVPGVPLEGRGLGNSGGLGVLGVPSGVPGVLGVRRVPRVPW